MIVCILQFCVCSEYRQILKIPKQVSRSDSLKAHSVTSSGFASWMRSQATHLSDVFVFVPLGYNQQLGQRSWVVDLDPMSHLPDEILLMLVELCVRPLFQDLPQLLLLCNGVCARGGKRTLKDSRTFYSLGKTVGGEKS